MATNSDWQTTVKQALLQDPKKTFIMSVLGVVLVIMGGRAIGGGGASHPATAAGNIVMPMNAPAPVPPVRPTANAVRSDASLRNWLAAPLPTLSRNNFVVRADAFPIDASKPGAELSDGSFWSAVEKSLAVQADQKDRRQSQIDALKAQAEAIRPQSTMMGIHPRAMVNGVLLAEGDTVESFRLLKVEPRGIIVERDGVRFEVPMR